ncbi:MAG TPA: glycosyltransferase [Parafilimonas sp.]|nr:glycosyltransferase [Parafilimonas sp.]
MEKHLHIISLNIPYPADYGGVYDLFYKLPALQNEGVKIHLHCFTKDRAEQSELNKYCEEVFYYQRNTGGAGLSSDLPYIVASRFSKDLAQRLLKDNYPVLMEGAHCTAITNDTRFANRKKFVRVHNVENEYYYQLYKFSRNTKKAIFYWLESKRLYKYEKKLVRQADAFWTVATHDVEYYHKEFDCKNIKYLPLFIPAWKLNAAEGMGEYCLYHGALEIEENEYAVKWLVQKVFNNIDLPFVVAGKNPSKTIVSLAKKYKHISLVSNPDEKQMQDIISKAHLHVLPSFNNTGIKIKLLNALYNGRHCVVNDAMITGNSLKNMCHVVNSADEFKERIQLLYHQPFSKEEKLYRQKLLETEFSNEKNAKQIVQWIWKDQV